MNRWDAGCSEGGFVTDFNVQGGLHEPNLESHIGNHEPGVRIYIGLDNPPHRAIGFEAELGSIRIMTFLNYWKFKNILRVCFSP
jgi:hypothetical protein